MAAIVGVLMLVAVASTEDVEGAVNTLREAGYDVDANTYLISEEQRTAPLPAFPPAVMARVACIERKESGGANVWNRQGSGAGGTLQYMEGTFRRSAAEMGHPEWSRWVPWQARLVAAHDLTKGRRAQWTVGGC